MTATRLLIVGAGPTGLTAALEAARHGLEPIVLDRNAGPTRRSRAVGVNRQSLQLLEPSGSASRLIAHAVTLQRARFFDAGRPLAVLDIPQPQTGPPTLIALPQSETEAILVDRLAELGHRVMWNAHVKSIMDRGNVVSATLSNGETLESDYLLGADGSRSMVRRGLDIRFDGSRYDDTWSLADVRVDWPFPDSQAAAWFTEGGAVVFLITLGQNRFRAISNRPCAREQVQQLMPVKEVLIDDEFTVSLKRVDCYGRGRIWLAGDAAHVHSPVGGMGMNLGIEDAVDFIATLAAAGTSRPDFEAYEAQRLKAAKRVLAVSDRGYRFITATSPAMRWLRNATIRTVVGLSPLRNAIARLVFRGT